MKQYTVRVVTTVTDLYHVDALSPEEARELVLSGDYDPFRTEDALIDDIYVLKEDENE